MPMALIIVIAILSAGYLLLVFNSLWVYSLFDHALRNNRDFLPRSYELPCYFTKTPDGKVDISARWPGWDGWYFFLFPDDRSLPVKMIRASIMTGLYGLNGVDDYKALPPGVSPFDAGEHLVLIPTEISGSEEMEQASVLFHQYLPKRLALNMKADTLDVSITGPGPATGKGSESYGRVEGAWPDYKFDFTQPEARITISVRYHAEKVVWWADVPGIFTYFASFGTYEGTLKHARGASDDRASGAEEVTIVKGSGGFEHGFARKPFNFDSLWLPVRLVGAIIPSFRPVRYHYELLIGDGGLRGGFMLARGFGISFRNRGGLYLDGKYIPVESVEIEYIEDEASTSGERPQRQAVPFPRTWRVRASTPEERLEYTGTREGPPPAISSNMTYYNFTFTGRYKGQPTSGRGYGEYLNI